MFPDMYPWLKILLAAIVSFVVAYMMTPPVKTFAEKVGAIDIPKDDRRIHDHPIPRMGGIAIFIGFMASMLVFVEMNHPVIGMLVGALIIAVMGAIDDIVTLNAWVKLTFQVLAAIVAIRCGVVVDAISNPNILSNVTTINVGWLSIPLTLIWIIGCTNAVNLIDGLDGLAVGVSAISSFTMLIVAMFVAEPTVAIILAALTGACVGFMPYNMNPAKIFMGDVGSQLLGFILASASIMGLFKFHAIITFFVPLLALGVPIFDTSFAFIRRIIHKQSPFHADKKHLHHRLLALGLSQKQAVAVLYAITCILGITGVILASSGAGKAILLLLAVILVCTIGFNVLAHSGKKGQGDKTEENSSEAETSDADNAADTVEVTDQAEEKAENEEKTE